MKIPITFLNKDQELEINGFIKAGKGAERSYTWDGKTLITIFWYEPVGIPNPLQLFPSGEVWSLMSGLWYL